MNSPEVTITKVPEPSSPPPAKTRHQVRAELGRIGEIAVVAVLGRLPRKLRRGAGRMYGAAAHRQLRGLPPQKHANKAVVDWILREYKDIETKQEAERVASNDGVEVQAIQEGQ